LPRAAQLIRSSPAKKVTEANAMPITAKVLILLDRFEHEGCTATALIKRRRRRTMTSRRPAVGPQSERNLHSNEERTGRKQ
jgi:hypothetical protein